MKTTRRHFNSIRTIALFIVFSMLFQMAPIGVLASPLVDYETGKEINLQVFVNEKDSANPVSGVMLELTDVGGFYQLQVTDSDGVASFTEVPAGDYSISELGVPEPYLENNNITPVTIVGTDTAFVNRENEQAKGIITINKKDGSTNAPLPGATYEVKNEYETFSETITTDENGIATSSSLTPGVYFIEEIVAPVGYSRVTEVKQVNLFYVNSSTPLITSSVDFDGVESRGKVSLHTRESVSGNPIEGAKFRLSTIDGEFLGMFTTDENGIISVDTLDLGDYVFEEFSVPDGYVSTVKSYSFNISNTEVVIVDAEYDHTQIDIFIRDVETDAQVPGATVQVLNSDDEIITEFDTTNNAQRLNGIPAGQYTLSIKKAAPGYVISDELTFSVASDTNLQTVVMHSDFTKVEISSKDLTTGNILPGSTFQILQDDTVVHEWDSTETAHKIERLPSGTYILRETTAPKGYAKTSDKTIEIAPTAEVQKIAIDKISTQVDVLVEVIGKGVALSGVTLQILDDSSDVVYEWVSTNDPYTISKIPAGDYTLKQLSAPDGYLLSEAVPFTVSAVSEPLVLTMNNDYTKLEIVTVDFDTEKPLSGVSFEIIDGSGKVVKTWKSTEEKMIINALPVGTYTLRESSTTPGFSSFDSIIINVKNVATVQEIRTSHIPTFVEFFVQDIKTEDALIDVSLQIMDSEGKIVKALKTIDGANYVKYLPVGTYTLLHTGIPAGYLPANGMEFTVKNRVGVQPIYSPIDFTKVELTISDEDLLKKLEGARILIIDEAGNTVRELTPQAKMTIERLPIGKYTLKTNLTDADAPSLTHIAFEVGTKSVPETIVINTFKVETPDEEPETPVEKPTEETEEDKDTEDKETENKDEDSEDVTSEKTDTDKLPAAGSNSTTTWLYAGILIIAIGATLFLTSFTKKKA